MAEAMAGGGFDPTQMMLPMMLSALTSGQSGSPSGISNYVPRFSNPNFGNPSTMGLPGMMGQFGPMGSTIGMLGMMGGYSFMPELMNRLQANANVDPIQLRQQQTMHHSMMQYMQMNGQQIAGTLGHPEWGGAIGTAMPFLSAMPGMQSMVSALTPNSLTSFGAQSMAQTAMMMDPSGRLRKGDLSALERARERLTQRNGMRDAAFMSGFNQDEFASIGLFAQDQGFDAQDVDRSAIRESNRQRVMDRKYKGRAAGSLSSAEQADVEFETSRDTRAELHTRATSMAADVLRTTMSTMGVDKDTAMQFGQQAGFTAHGKDDVDNIKRAMRELEGFTQAAHVGGQEMLNLAKALQAQNGGGMLFNTAVAASTMLTNRFVSESARTMGLTGKGNGDAISGDITNVQEAFAQGGYANTMASMMMLDSKAKKRFEDLAKSGDHAGAFKLLDDSVHGRGEFAETAKRAGQMNITKAEMDQTMNQFTADVGFEAAAGVTTGVVEEAERKRLESDPRMAGFFKENEANQDLISMYVAGTATSEDLDRHGISASTYEDAMAVAKGSQGLSQGRAFFAARVNRMASSSSKKVRDNIANNRLQIEEMKKRHQQAGAGQGLIPNLVKGNVKNFADAFEAMGYAMSAEESKFLGGLEDETQEAFLDANRDRLDALKVLDNTNSSEDQKKEAKDKMRAALQFNQGLGYEERSDHIRKIMGMPAENAINGKDIQGQDGSGAQKADDKEAPAKNGKEDKTSKQEVNVKTDAKLEIDIKINGQSLALTDFAGKAAENSGYRDIVINGRSMVG